ncbi:PREDICTED: E3 ubiquitin-protein ligase RING1-like [Dufourea novaeangliae]|uniref:E3 ubiquitin-protein ligase RING1-like n=1 Tax=Dufourea novaeangliae TaxID=178035 RepID=UPI0007673331|nr:PREDICTED: E3 ubiquitin-protein ligase RING1-like [Dufourea novaeangliae]
MTNATFAILLVGCAIASALYYFFGSSEEQPQPQHSYNNGRSRSPRNDTYDDKDEYRDGWPSRRLCRSSRGRSDGNCSICLEPVMPGRNLKTTPCNHVFHEDCLYGWNGQKDKKSCPNCRQLL